jgi:hypothetical protein
MRPSSASTLVRLLGLVGALLWGAQAAQAASFPETLNYQGRLRLTSGAAVADGPHSLAVALYTTPTGGTSIWSEAITGVQTKDGLFNVQLGKLTPLSGLNWDQPYYLGVDADGDGEMTPRTPLAMAPYAYRAKYADTAFPISATAGNPTALIFASNGSSAAKAIIGVGKAGFLNSTGIHGEGGTGVFGISNTNNGVGVAAYQGPGQYALKVSGNAHFSAGTVDFSGVTVTGLPAAGEANTASDRGTGVGLTGAKLGVDLTFKSLRSPSNTISLSSNSDEVSLDADNGSAIWNADRLQGINVQSGTPGLGDSLIYNAGSWQWGAVDATKIKGYSIMGVTPVNGDSLTFSGGNWNFGPANADRLNGASVSALAPSLGDVLSYNGSQWVNGPADAQKLDGQNLNLGPANNGDYLQYQGANWVNAPLSLGGASLFLGALMPGQALVYNGTQWVNDYPDAQKIDGTTVQTTGLANGDVLT